MNESCKKVIIKFLLFNDLPSYLGVDWGIILKLIFNKQDGKA